MKRRIIISVIILSLCAVALVMAGGSVVILKNGQKLRCREPMTIQGKNAIITMVTGVVTSYPLSQVDLIATERYNQLGLGDALTIDALEQRDVVKPTPTPRPSLGSLAKISAENVSPDLGMEDVDPTPTPGIMLKTHGYHDPKVNAAIREVLDKENLYLYRTSAGTKPEYFFIQATTDSEKEVFGAIRAVAKAFSLIVSRAPELAPEAIELKMVETSGRTAGTFRMSPGQAKAVADDSVPIEKYYVENVIF